jgi:hypothetical protein
VDHGGLSIQCGSVHWHVLMYRKDLPMGDEIGEAIEHTL